jgi:cyclic-di-GMP-binding protein
LKNSFFLVIPAQETNPERLKEFEPKALEQWLFELPTANPGLATRLIQDFITNFNALKMPLQLRLDALEMMRPKVLIIEDYLRSRLIKASFPKEENDLKILQVLALLEREFTIGYWIVLKELTHRQISWFQGKSLVLSLQRCIKGLSSVVVSHYIMGLPVPDWVWIDLHSLYKLSVKLKKDTVKASDSTNFFGKASSPEESYRQIVLLSLSMPTGLMQKEILQVYSFIENLYPFFNLSAQAIDAQQFQFAILTDEDKPPFAQIEMYTAKDSSTLFLDLTRLYKALEKKDKFINPTQTRFASIHMKSNEEKPTTELLEYLEQRWLGIGLQREAIFSDRLDRYMAVGIAPAHSLQSSSSPQGKPVDNEIDQEFLVQSESDRLLFCVFNKTGVLSVGNLISFRRADQPAAKRALGIVNELIVSKQSNRINFGVSLVTMNYHAVYYIITNAADKDIPLKGLFYNAADHLDEASFLIVDNFMLKDGDVIKMQLNQENILLIVRNKKNVGLGYWQFECNRRAATATSDQPQSKKGYDFI